MKKHIPVSLALVGLLTLTGVGTAVAVGDNPAPTPGQTLADYMGDDNDAQWDKVQTWIEAEYGDGATVPAPAPEPTTEPTTDPEPEPTTPAGPALTDAKVTATADNKIVLEGKVTGYTGQVTFRASAYVFTDQAGYPVQGTPAADGTIRLEVEDYNNTDPKYWQLETGGSTWEYGEVIAEGEVGQPAAPAPEPTTPPTTEPTTPPASGEGNSNGTGGAYTNRTFQSFTSNGLTSRYHVYAEGLDRTKPIGILLYGDGSGGYGFDNPTQSYLIGGTNGLAAVAKKHNLVLVVPEAPAPGCDNADNCWYNIDLATAQGKAKWASDLMTRVKGQYPIDLSRVVVGGYSSGAQLTTQTFINAHGANQSVDLAVPIAYGGAPRGGLNAPAEWKNDVVISWDTGTADVAYGTESYESLGGYNEYKRLGFKTDATWPAGVGHGRSGEFGGIIDREITQHLK